MTRSKDIIRASLYGIYVNIILVLFKSIIGIASNSIAIILDAINNFSDILSSVITIIGSKLSNRKPDKEHPFGHGRIEYFTAIVIAVIILIMGVTCLKESIGKIVNPVVPKYSIIILIFITVSILAKYLLSYYYKLRGEELNSRSLIASGIDSMWDSIITFSTLVTAIISMFFDINLEGYVGVFISALILKSALSIFKSNLDDMIGIRADKKLTDKLKRKINSYEDVLGVHDLTLHNYGPNNIIATAHIDILEDTPAKEIYRLTREITIDIYTKYGIILTLGIYPSNKKEYKVIKRNMYELIKEYNTILEIHGFYVDEEEKTVSFDIIFDFKEENQIEIVKELKEKLEEKFDKYKFMIIIDKDMSD